MTAAADRAAGVLSGLRVLDFGQYIAGPMVGMFLADSGADVIHVDPPGGPSWDHPSNAALQRGKRSVELDLKTPAGLAEARRLIASADVVIENFRPGVMPRLGLDPAAACERNAALIWCSIPGFAADDPRASLRAWEGIVTAAAGLYPPPGFRDGDPVFTALPMASSFGAFVAAHRVLAALIGRLRSGRGRRIEVSLFEACFQGISYYADVPAARDLAQVFVSKLAPLLRMRPTAGGRHLFFDTPLRGLQAFVDRYLPGHDLRLLDDAQIGELAARLDALILQKPAAEWERIGQEELQGAFGLVQPAWEWVRDRHALDSGCVVEVEDPLLGPTLQAGFPVRLSRTPMAVRSPRQAPAAAAGIDWLLPKRADPALPAATSGLPLEGLRVLDCSSLLAGPTASRVLAQYGAEVVKLDKAALATAIPDPLSDDEYAFIGARAVNAGKRMVFVDLKAAAGQEILRALLARSDVVHHNFTPAAADRLGLSAAAIRGCNPSAIVTTMSLHSAGGFRAAYRGHDIMAQCTTGLASRLGGVDAPALASIYPNDFAAGHLHAYGILLAFLHRHLTGEAQEVNSSLSRTATMLQLPLLTAFDGKAWDEPSGLQARGWHALDRLYRGRDGWFYLAAGGAGRSRLAGCDGLAGVGDVDDGALEGWLERRFAAVSVDEAVAALRGAGFAAHRHSRLEDLIADRYMRSRGLICAVEHPGLGKMLGIGLPVYPHDGACRDRLAMRRPGLDTVAVLDELGFGARTLRLLQDGVVAIGEKTLLNAPAASGFWATALRTSLFGGVTATRELVAELERSEPWPAFAVPGAGATQHG
ncbi:MAG: CoA transferase [Rubrivivax sp.]